MPPSAKSNSFAQRKLEQMEMEATALTYAFPHLPGWLLLDRRYFRKGSLRLARWNVRRPSTDGTEAQGLLAICLSTGKGEHESAYHLFLSLLSLRPRDPVLHYNTGLSTVEMGRPVDAGGCVRLHPCSFPVGLRRDLIGRWQRKWGVWRGCAPL